MPAAESSFVQGHLCLDTVRNSLTINYRVNARHDVMFLLRHGSYGGAYLRHALLRPVASSGHICHIIILRCLGIEKVLGRGLGRPAAVAEPR